MEAQHVAEYGFSAQHMSRVTEKKTPRARDRETSSLPDGGGGRSAPLISAYATVPRAAERR